MIKTVGELRKAIEDIPKNTPLIKIVKVSIAKAHFHKDGSFLTFHHGEGYGCCRQATDRYYDTDLRDGLIITN